MKSKLTTNYPDDLTPRIITKSEFSSLYKIVCHRAITAHYNDYLELVGKKPFMKLTTIDIFKIDQIIL